MTKAWTKTERNSEYDANESKSNFRSSDFVEKWRHRTKNMEESDLRSEINVMFEIVTLPIWDYIDWSKLEYNWETGEKMSEIIQIGGSLIVCFLFQCIRTIFHSFPILTVKRLSENGNSKGSEKGMTEFVIILIFFSGLSYIKPRCILANHAWIVHGYFCFNTKSHLWHSLLFTNYQKPAHTTVDNLPMTLTPISIASMRIFWNYIRPGRIDMENGWRLRTMPEFQLN
jgi:hypothetical protein